MVIPGGGDDQLVGDLFWRSRLRMEFGFDGISNPDWGAGCGGIRLSINPAPFALEGVAISEGLYLHPGIVYGDDQGSDVSIGIFIYPDARVIV